MSTNSKEPNRWPYYIAEGLSDEVKSNLWQQAQAHVHNKLFTYNKSGRPVTSSMIIIRTDEAYARLVVSYKREEEE